MRARMLTIEIRDLHRAPASIAPRRLHENSVDLKRKTAEVSSGRFQSKVALRAGTKRFCPDVAVTWGAKATRQNPRAFAGTESRGTSFPRRTAATFLGRS